MKEIRILLLILFITVSIAVSGQTRKELEAQRIKTLEEIDLVDNLIKETVKERSSGINDLKIIGSKISLRENVLSGMSEEIGLLLDRISWNTSAIEMMENDLFILKKDYAKTIINSYKTRKRNPEIVYILSAKDFNQGYKRFKYLQQLTKFRRRQAELITDLKNEIEISKRKLQDDLIKMSDLKIKEEKQKELLQQEQERKRRIVNLLSSKEKQLKSELDGKKRIAKRIETEIAKVIEEERKRSINNELTPEQKLIGDNFIDNKGRLPWPVGKGIITSKFGIHKHPVLTLITEDNPGIEITSPGKTMARSVFKGQVTKVFSFSGANWAIIIQHGKYRSVYQNLINVKVKQGDMVDTKQELGEVFCDLDDGSKSILKFWIFEEKEKIDPEVWITKK